MRPYTASGLTLIVLAIIAGGCGPEIAALSSTNHEEALLAVDRIENQAALKKVVLRARELDIKLKALGRITDQTILSEIAMDGRSQTSPYLDFSPDAAKRITDPDILLNLAQHADNPKVQEIATERIPSQAMLEQLAQTGPTSQGRSVAVKRTSNIALLDKIALDDESSDVREEALKRVTNQAVLEKALYRETGEARTIAIRRLNNEELLTEIALNDADYPHWDRLWAIAGIRDTSALKRVAEKYRETDYAPSSKSVHDVLVFSLARLMAREDGRTDREGRIDSYLRQCKIGEEYRQRIGPLADVIYMFEDPQLIERWGQPRMIMYTYWKDEPYGFGRPGVFGRSGMNSATLYIETIAFELKFEKQPEIRIDIKSPEGRHTETFETRRDGFLMDRSDYAALSWPRFVAYFRGETDNQKELFSELQKTSRYQELLKANSVEGKS